MFINLVRISKAYALQNRHITTGNEWACGGERKVINKKWATPYGNDRVFLI